MTLTSPLAPRDVDRFRQVITESLGLKLGDDKLPLLGELLLSRLAVPGGGGVEEYVGGIPRSPEELSALAARLLVTETYFLRNRDQFHAVASILRARSGSMQPLRMLSAGCASGEEAFSLAMVAIEERVRRLEIRGVDINPEALAAARRAVYTPWSLREMPAGLRDRYLEAAGPRRFTVVDNLRAAVTFEAGNLLDGSAAVWRRGPFEVIFCRNVLMYLTPAAASRVVAHLASCLAPEGHLFLGHAETLRGLSTSFHLCHDHGCFYYRKRPAAEAEGPRTAERAESPATTPPDAWHAEIARSSRRVAQLVSNATPSGPAGGSRRQAAGEARAPQAPEATLQPALELLAAERFQEALALLTDPSGGVGRDADQLLLRAVLEMSSGDVAAAERCCAEILALDELNAGAHYLTALCREQAGDASGAAEHDQIAAYLDPSFAMPRLHRGLLARRAGDPATAIVELRAAVELLPTEDLSRLLLFAGGFGRQALLDLCEGELRALGGGR